MKDIQSYDRVARTGLLAGAREEEGKVGFGGGARDSEEKHC
jgi:hypothetical protein